MVHAHYALTTDAAVVGPRRLQALAFAAVSELEERVIVFANLDDSSVLQWLALFVLEKTRRGSRLLLCPVFNLTLLPRLHQPSLQAALRTEHNEVKLAVDVARIAGEDAPVGDMQQTS